MDLRLQRWKAKKQSVTAQHGMRKHSQYQTVVLVANMKHV